MAESEELKSLLMKVKEESEKAGLKLSLQETKILASSPIASWQIDGETVETVTDFIFLDSKNHYRWWLPWNLKTVAPWKESYDQSRRHIKKQRHYFASNGLSSQSNGFSSSHVWMWELDCKKSWAPRTDVFELWCWRRLLRVPWTARRSDKTILKEISPGCSLEGLMLKLKLPIFWPPDAKSWLIGKDPDVGKDRRQEKGTIEDEIVGWHHWLNAHEFG